MKYALRFLIIAFAMLSSVAAYSAAQVNWFNKTDQKTPTTTSSRWSPVSSDVNVTSSRYNRNIDFTTHRYYSSSGGKVNINVTNNRSFKTDRSVNNSVRGNSVASKTHFTNRSYNFDANINAQLADFGSQEYATTGEDYEGLGGRPRQQRIGEDTEDELFEELANPSTEPPLTDAVPCLVVMILAFAVIKYRKMH